MRITDQERLVELLQGQALFNVAKDSARPFFAMSDDARVRAVGTQFDINRRRTGTTVTVLEGRVAVVAMYPIQGFEGAKEGEPGRDRQPTGEGQRGTRKETKAIRVRFQKAYSSLLANSSL